jgi:hypothetical protein
MIATVAALASALWRRSYEKSPSGKVPAFLRAVATLLVLGWLIGFLVTVSMMLATAFQIANSANTPPQTAAADAVVPAASLSLALRASFIGDALFPLGIFLHWIIARFTRVCPRWAWRTMFVSSVLFCVVFPVGTVLGGVALWLLFASDPFGKMRQGGIP